MEIKGFNEDYFSIVPEGATESNALKRFPGFLRSRGNFLFPKKPTQVRNIIERLKKSYKKPIDCTKELIDCMRTEEKLKEIPEGFPWINKPYPHQELALRFLYTHGSAGLLLEPGLGKTFVVLNYIYLMKFKKSIIVCPKALCFVWEDEVAEHRPELSVHVMESTTWESKLANAEARAIKWREKLAEAEEGTKAYNQARTNVRSAERDLERLPGMRDADYEKADAADVVVMNYEKAVPGLDWALKQKFDFIAVDEGLIKDPSTKRTKAIEKLGQSIPHRTIMSGTLINNSPLDIFAPVRFLAPALVSTAYGRFEHYYAKMAKLRDGRQFVAGVSRANTDEIRDILAACSIVMTKDEWLDLPEKNFHTIQVPMTEPQRSIYEDLAANLIAKVGDDFIEVDSPLTLAGKLNQISNGFAYMYEQEEDDWFAMAVPESKGARETVWIDSNKKDALKNLLEGDCKGKKLILWYNLTAEYNQIVDALEEMGIEYLAIKGGSKDTGGTVRKFNGSGTHQVLVCQSQAVNYGITVLGKDPDSLDKDVPLLPDFDTRCHTQIFWSISWSLERFLQQQDRIHRIGQQEDCDYYVLLTEGSIEEGIYERLGEKKEINEAILVDIIKSIS